MPEMEIPLNIANSVTAWARATPEAPAILTPEGALSYAELDRAVAWSADSFRKAGLEPGTIVAVRLANKPQHMLAALALFRLGVGHIAFAEDVPVEVQHDLTRHLGIVAMVADSSDAGPTEGRIVAPPPGGIDDIGKLPSVDFPAVCDAALPCLLTTTSGTGGVPKVGLVTQGLLQKRLRYWNHGLPGVPKMRLLPMPAMSFPGAKVYALSALVVGGCMALVDGRTVVADLIAFIKEHRINHIFGAPIHAQSMIRMARQGELLLPDLDVFRLGTAVIPETLRREIQERLTPNFFVSYGSSENGVITLADTSLMREIPGVVGYPLPDVEIEVIDDADRPLPPGEVGRIRLRSGGMIDGYLDSSGESAAAFRDGWLYPGDLGEFTPDGALIHYGRADDMMIRDGINIYPAEIENALLRHPAVVEVAAFPVKHRRRGDLPVAAVVTNAEVSSDELLGHCRSWLGAKSPAGIMTVDKLPRNANGKVLKKELETQYLKAQPGAVSAVRARVRPD
jgi:acyl-coenzyme A synthetase/AMP-(fatty) acid ligase